MNNYDVIIQEGTDGIGWECDLCGYANNKGASRCERCSTQINYFGADGAQTTKNSLKHEIANEEETIKNIPKQGKANGAKTAQKILQHEIQNELKTTQNVPKHEILNEAETTQKSPNPEIVTRKSSISCEDWICKDCNNKNRGITFYCSKCCDVDPKYQKESKRKNDRPSHENERRLILVGRTGCGKSATGNTILNKKAFVSDISSSSVTKYCKSHKAMRFGKMYHVVDTPGFFDTDMDNENVMKEILKCVAIAAPGPHAILLVIAINRFTEEERDTVRLLQEAFGEKMENYIIFIFTRKDELDRNNKHIDDLLSPSHSPPCLRLILQSCENRYLAWNNNAGKDENEYQSKKLFDIIEELLQKNKGDFYQSEIFNETENIIKERAREILQEKEIEHRSLRKERSFKFNSSIGSLLGKKEELKRQLHSFQEHGEMDVPAIQKDDQELPGGIHCVSTDNTILQDSETLIEENLVSEITKIEQQEFELYDEEVYLCLNWEDQYEAEYEKFDPREIVKNEIEQGNLRYLQKVWFRLQTCGKRITMAFRSIFDAIKNKVKNKKNEN